MGQAQKNLLREKSGKSGKYKYIQFRVYNISLSYYSID